MTQASDLGAIANQPGAFFRARNNANIQAIATQHYGAAEPPVLYPNMIWYSSGDGYVKLRSPTNTSWQTIGTIGPPLKWTNIDLPAEGFITGDIKGSYNSAQPTGWQHLNEGTIGGAASGAQSRSNPDCWPLFSLLWAASTDDWCSVYAQGTMTRTGRGANSLADWNASRHIALPKMAGRVPASMGSAPGIGPYYVATWHGTESVTLGPENMPTHAHSFSASVNAHNHGMAAIVDNLAPTAQGQSFGEGTGNLRIVNKGTDLNGAFNIVGNTSTSGSGTPHSNIQPTTYVFYFIKL